MDLRDRGGPLGGRWVDGAGRSRRRRAPRRRGYGSEGGFGLRWFPIEAEALGSSARTRGSEWWRWMGGGVSGCDEWHRKAAAAEPAGGGGDGLFRSIHG